MERVGCGDHVGRQGSGGEATIGQEARSGNVSRFRAGQIRHKARDFGGLTIAAQGHVAAQRVGKRSARGVHVGIDWSRLDVVDRDAAGAEVAGESLGEAGDGTLAQRVNRTTRERHGIAVYAADIDDASAIAQMTRRFLRGDEHSADIDRHDPVEIFDGKIGNGCHGGDTGVVDENIEATEAIDSFIYRCPRGSCVAGIGLDGEGTAAGSFDGPDDFVRLGLGVAVGQSDHCSVIGKAARDGSANAARSPGDDCDLAGEFFGNGEWSDIHDDGGVGSCNEWSENGGLLGMLDFGAVPTDEQDNGGEYEGGGDHGRGWLNAGVGSLRY